MSKKRITTAKLSKNTRNNRRYNRFLTMPSVKPSSRNIL